MEIPLIAIVAQQGTPLHGDYLNLLLLYKAIDGSLPRYRDVNAIDTGLHELVAIVYRTQLLPTRGHEDWVITHTLTGETLSWSALSR